MKIENKNEKQTNKNDQNQYSASKKPKQIVLAISFGFLSNQIEHSLNTTLFFCVKLILIENSLYFLEFLDEKMNKKNWKINLCKLYK